MQTLAIRAVRRTQQFSSQLYLGFFFDRLEPTEPWSPLLLALPESLTSFLDDLDGSALPLSIFPLADLPWSVTVFSGFELFPILELSSDLELAVLLPDDLLSAGLPFAGLPLADFSLVALSPACLLLADLPEPGTL